MHRSSVSLAGAGDASYDGAVTAPGDDVERRVARLERDVARLREELTVTSSDAGAARALAAGADRDVSEVRAELRAHTSALNALRQTQLKHGEALDRLPESFQHLEGSFQHLEGSFQHLRESFHQQAAETSRGFAMVRSGMAQIVALLATPWPTRTELDAVRR